MSNAITKQIIRQSRLRDLEHFVWEDDFFEGGYARDLALTAESDPAGSKFGEVADVSSWLVSLVDGGGDNGETITIVDDGRLGQLKLLANDADNDVVHVQLNGEAFQLAAGKETVIVMRFKVTDVSETDWAIGLAVASANYLGGVTDGIALRCHDSTGDIDYVIEKDSVETTADTGVDLADDTFVTAKFVCDGVSLIRLFINDLFIAAATTNIPDNEALSPFITIRNDGAVAQSIVADILRVAGDR